MKTIGGTMKTSFNKNNHKKSPGSLRLEMEMDNKKRKLKKMSPKDVYDCYLELEKIYENLELLRQIDELKCLYYELMNININARKD